MRVLAFALLLVGASAVTMTHRLAADHQLAKIAQTSSLGKTLLLEMQTKIDAGLPIDELEKVIQEVTDRIEEAEAADKKQYAQRKENCTIDIARYNANIAQAKEDIARTKNEINKAEAEYDALVAKTKTLEGEIAKLDQEVEELMGQIEAGRALRAKQHAEFVNRSTDTTSVIAAIEEIKGVETGSTLKELFPDADSNHTTIVNDLNADTDARGRHAVGDIDSEEAADVGKGQVVQEVKDTTTDIENDRMYEWKDSSQPALVRLQALAKHVTDPTTKSFLQVAAQAAAALSGSDYENLVKLLDELLEELRVYTEDLIRTEKQRAVDWTSLENTYTHELRTKQESKHNKQQELEQTYRDKKDKAQQIYDLRNALDEYEQVLADNEQMLADRTVECQTFKEQHEARSAERQSELETLKQITDILEKKLKSTLASNQRVSDGVNAGV